MSNDDHSRRAMAELDLALRAASRDAARSHFDLSSTHMATLRELKLERSLAPATA